MRSNPSRLPKQLKPEPTHQRSLAARWFEAWLDWCDAVARQDPKLLARTKAITSMLNELQRGGSLAAGCRRRSLFKVRRGRTLGMPALHEKADHKFEK